MLTETYRIALLGEPNTRLENFFQALPGTFSTTECLVYHHLEAFTQALAKQQADAGIIVDLDGTLMNRPETLLPLAGRLNGIACYLVTSQLPPPDQVIRFIQAGFTDCLAFEERFKILPLLHQRATYMDHLLGQKSDSNLQALRHAHERAQYYLDIANVMILGVDETFTITLINNKGCEILGYDSPQELIGQNLLETLVPERNRSKIQELIEACFANNKAMVDYSEEMILTKLGDERLIGWNNAMIDLSPAHGKKVLLSSGRDITEDTLLRQRKETFVATLTHDLKTPIRAEYQALELLIQESFGPITELQREVLMEVLQSNRFMQQMVDNLLAIYKYEDHQVSLNLEPVDLNPFFLSLLKREIQAQIEEKQQTLQLDLEENLPPIRADKAEIRRVLLSLLRNAHMFSPVGATITVKTALDPAGKAIRVTVKDTGQGIEPEVIRNLFNRYSSITKKFRQVGTGLSLYLARQIVESHGGQIGVKSKVGQGSEFYLTLPLSDVAVDESPLLVSGQSSK